MAVAAVYLALFYCMVAGQGELGTDFYMAAQAEISDSPGLGE